nr:hypothetical protein [Nitrosopumilus sp.]
EKKKIIQKLLKNKPISKNLPTISSDFELFNESIGLPINRNTGLPQKMTPYQIDYHNAIQSHHRVIANKSRKIGATEAALRSIAFNCFRRYAGHDVIILAGNELRIAREFLKRFDELFFNKKETGCALVGPDGTKWMHDDIITHTTFGNTPEIEFFNGTRIMAFASSKSVQSQSFRGTDDVICIYVSEAAHTGMRNDRPIMTALEPTLANRDNADFIIESTPNGRRGFFYEYWKSVMTSLEKHYHVNTEKEALEKLSLGINVPQLDWCPLFWDYTQGVKYKVLSEKYLESQKSSPNIDFEQEYCCKFSSTYDTAIPYSSLSFLNPNDPKYEKPIDLNKMLDGSSDDVIDLNELCDE